MEGKINLAQFDEIIQEYIKNQLQEIANKISSSKGVSAYVDKTSGYVINMETESLPTDKGDIKKMLAKGGVLITKKGEEGDKLEKEGEDFIILSPVFR